MDERAAKQLSAQLREGESESPVAAASGLSDTAAALGVQRDEFAVPTDIAYFNTANLSPQLHRVRAAGEIALDRRSRPWSIAAEDWFIDVERLRGLFADMIGANMEGIALVPSTSYGFAVAARNLPLAPADRVLVLAEEYPSGIYTWRAATRAVAAEILTVHRETGKTWTDAVLSGLDERVSIVSVPQVHWIDGSLIDLAAVSARAQDVGARLVIDESQSIGAMPLDVAALRPDFVVTVGYKWLLGPFGLGYLRHTLRHGKASPGGDRAHRGCVPAIPNDRSPRGLDELDSTLLMINNFRHVRGSALSAAAGIRRAGRGPGRGVEARVPRFRASSARCAECGLGARRPRFGGRDLQDRRR